MYFKEGDDMNINRRDEESSLELTDEEGYSVGRKTMRTISGFREDQFSPLGDVFIVVPSEGV